jgi:translation initiation factor 5
MPKLLAKVEGKGNGIKTVIVNMLEVSKSLNRPPMYAIKYFGGVLGAQVSYDSKNDRYIVNGSHEASRLQDLLDGFIQKYVLCPSCSNPETVLTVHAKKSLITTSCKACGYGGNINSTDKLATYIIKCPPGTTEGSTPSGKEAKVKKTSKKSASKKNGDANGSSSPKNDSDDAGDEPDCALGSPIAENPLNGGNDDDNEEWCEDTNADAVAKRMEELSVGGKALMHNDDLEKSTEERLMLFLNFVQKKKESSPEGFDVQSQKEIVAEADRLDVKDKAVLALCDALFDDNIIQEVKTHRMLLLRVSLFPISHFCDF